MHSNIFRILLLKVLMFGWEIIGRIERWFSKNKKVSLQKIKKITFNRADRIGDAIVTLPLLLLFAKYLKEKLQLEIELEVLSSKLNNFVFQEHPDFKNYYTISLAEIEINNYATPIMQLLKKYINNFLMLMKLKKKSTIASNASVFVDLIWDPNHIKHHYLNYQYIISCNLMPNNFITDYSLPKSYVGLSKDHLVDSYIKLLSWFFELWEDFEHYVYDHLDIFFTGYFPWEKDWILVFVGNKAFRNFSSLLREKLINSLAQRYPHINITVIDDHLNENYLPLSYHNFPENVSLVKNTFSLLEFREFAKKFQLIIGTDGGGMNLVRGLTNSITIYTLWNHYVWMKYPGNIVLKKGSLDKSFHYKKLDYKDQIATTIYKKSFLFPTLDYPLWDHYFDDFPVDELINHIHKFYANKF